MTFEITIGGKAFTTDAATKFSFFEMNRLKVKDQGRVSLKDFSAGLATTRTDLPSSILDLVELFCCQLSDQVCFLVVVVAPFVTVSGQTMVLNQGGVGRLKIAVQTFDAIDLHESAF